MAVEKPPLESLQIVRRAFAGHDFSDADLSELVAPKLGLITSFEDLMRDLERLRAVDLGATPPALNLTQGSPRKSED